MGVYYNSDISYAITSLLGSLLSSVTCSWALKDEKERVTEGPKN